MMIESNVIQCLDFGDLIQSMDCYSKKLIIYILSFFRTLSKNKTFPMIIDIILILIFFIQLWTMAIINVPIKGDIVLKILDYLKKAILFYELISNKSNYLIIFSIVFTIIIIDIILMTIVLVINNKINSPILIFIINLINVIIFYYLIGPIINISLSSIWCENNIHKYMNVTCYKDPYHLVITILSLFMLILYIFVAFLFSFYCNEIENIKAIVNKDNTFRINCNYEIFCLISKIFIFALGFFVKKSGDNYIYKSLYQSYIIANCLIMTIYSYNNIYYYNYLINYINHFGWHLSNSFTLCILLKTLLNLKGVSNFIIFSWIIIIIYLYKTAKIIEYRLLTENNIFEFKNIKTLEKYKNILLNYISDKNTNNNKSKILILGIIKKFEEFSKSNPEINYHYNKLLTDNNLLKKITIEDLPILSIIYILYSYYSEKFVQKEEVIFHMSYFVINKFNNPTYAMYLCSKLKIDGIKDLYFKYTLSEDIKDYLIHKLKKNSNKESIKHVQIGSVILYYLYAELFKIKIYDATTNQIEYFDLLKNNITTNKTTENFLKMSESILKCRKEIMNIWEKIIELNPFSDEYHKDYTLYLDNIIEDEFLSKEESKKYILLNNNKSQEKNNIYHQMFLVDTSSVLLVDGYLSYGKILYASQNFPFLFMYTGKELLSLFIDDLLPNCIQNFHKELIEDAVKYSNINYTFKYPKDSLLKNKNGGLFNVKLFIKQVPNLYYGLIYYAYLQKIHDQNFIIILDKDLKINGFTEMAQTGSLFTMNNLFNLSNNILGYNIGIIIPDILTLLEYKNDEFNIVKKNYELKGYMYPIEKIREIRNKTNIILDKIKTNNININDYQGQIEDDPQNISFEYNELIKELNKQNIKPYNIFYRIKLYTFLDDKYKYYRIYINNIVFSNNTINVKPIKLTKDSQENGDKYKKADFKSSHSKISSKKAIPLKVGDKKHFGFTNKTNKLEISAVSRNSISNANNQKKEDLKNQDESGNEKINTDNKINEGKKNILNKINSISLYNSKSNIVMSGFNKIKNDIINNKEIIPLKLMSYMSYIFCIITILFMTLEIYKQRASFLSLSDFLVDNLFFNKTKIAVASLYSISVNVRWLSHSIFLNNNSCLHGDWVNFYEILLRESLKYIEIQKNASNYLGEDFSDILTKKYPVELEVHRIPEKEKYEFSFDNIMTFLVNSIIKMVDIYHYFISLTCKEITPIMGLNETKLHNLIEQSYNFYISNISGYTGNSKNNKINKNFSSNQLYLVFYSILLIILLLIIITYAIKLHKIEIYFLDKLINFNSVNFDSYLKKLEEIKKKLRNDNSEDDEKADDLNFNDLDSKKKEDEEGDGIDKKEEKKLNEKDKKKKNKKSGTHQNKIRQLKKKKLKVMTLYLSKNNLFFIIKIILIMIISLTYYLCMSLVKSKYKNDYLIFDSINDSIYGVYKDSYDIFVYFKRELDLYERQLINCTTLENRYYLKLQKSNAIKTPKLGNLLMQITSASNFKKETINKFQLLYSENACKVLVEESRDIRYCSQYWSGVLLKGMEQSITHMGVVIEQIINELETLNLFNTPTVLYNLINESVFITYEQFMEYYMLRAYNQTTYIFKDLREEKLDSIFNAINYIFLIYIVGLILLFIVLNYILYSYKYILNTFLNFIGILPIQYIYEDENLYQEIISFGNKYY